MKKIILVYNADSGLLNAAKDYIHKIVSPDTYPCSLCAITYDNLGMKSEWKKFIKKIDTEVEILHKDEFHLKYPEQKERKLAAIFGINDNNEFTTIIDADDMNSMKDLIELKNSLEERLHLSN